jgi:hypothetical protein
MMTRKEKTRKALIKLVQKMYKIIQKYFDSLPEEGNEQGKRDGYFSVAIFKNYVSFGTVTKRAELKEENQIHYVDFKEDKNEVEDSKEGK